MTVLILSKWFCGGITFLLFFFLLQVQDLAEEGTWTVFVETSNPESNDRRLAHFDKDSKFMLS